MKRATALVAALLASSVAIGMAHAAGGRPYRGAIPWSVLLCKFKNAGSSARDVKFFEDMFYRRGTQGLADVWGDLSEGSLTLDGTAVKGWYDLPYTLAEAQKKQADLLALAAGVAQAHDLKGNTITNRVGQMSPEVAKQRLKTMGATNVQVQGAGKDLRALGVLKGKKTQFEIDPLRATVRPPPSLEVKLRENAAERLIQPQ